VSVVGKELRNKRVLILEDDPLLALDLEDFLIDLGAKVVGPASSVEQALLHIETGLDLAVIDLNLRGTYSFPVIERLRAKGVPFVVCSGYAELPETRNRLSGVYLLPKPCDFEKLRDALLDQVAPDFGRHQSSIGNRISATNPVGL
jgi:CheY-like chemotaxis protein